MNYLNAEQIIAINTKSILYFTPSEDVGIRSIEAINMAVEQPKQEVFGRVLYPTIYDKAAILLINLVKRHAFMNGNKRTGWAAMITFFAINGYKTDFSKDEGISLVMEITNDDNEDFDSLKKSVSSYLETCGKIQKA